MNLYFTTNAEFEQFAIEYAFRFRNCEQFTVNDLSMYLPNFNRTKLQYMLDDLAIKGTIKKIGDSFYRLPDNRSLEQKITDMFGNRFIFFTPQQIANALKERPDHIDLALQELVKSGKLAKCQFVGNSYWLAESN